MRLDLTFVLTYWIAGCKTQDFQYYKIVGVSEGQTCKPLPDPAHGKFSCKINTLGEECALNCQRGYVPPITYTPPKVLMDVRKRGVYRCVTVPGGITWSPDLLFDCVRKVVPRHFILHYGVRLAVDWSNGTFSLRRERKDLLHRMRRGSKLMKACGEVHTKCSLQMAMVSTGNYRVEADFEVYLPHTDSIAEKFPEIRKDLDEAIEEDSRLRNLKLPELKEAASVTPGVFYMNCPRGTRLEGDLTCRGCSKGFYLDLATAECRPCPVGTYQDRDLQAYCKPCPVSTRKDQDGLRDKLHCFYSGEMREYTSIETLLMALFCVVVVVSVVTYYRGTVTNEPGPDTVEKSLLPVAAKVDEEFAEGSAQSDVGSGDFRNGATTKGFPAAIKGMLLPVEPPVVTKEGWRARARERLELTLQATLLRQARMKRDSDERARLVQSETETNQEQEADIQEQKPYRGVKKSYQPLETGAKSWIRRKMDQVLRRR